MSYALITGASKGIGEAIACNLAAKKINLLLIAVQSLRTVGIESIRIFVFSGLKKSPKEFNLFYAKRPLCYIFFKEKGRRS